jgi:hypothetical protein
MAEVIKEVPLSSALQYPLNEFYTNQ